MVEEFVKNLISSTCAVPLPFVVNISAKGADVCLPFVGFFCFLNHKSALEVMVGTRKSSLKNDVSGCIT